MLNHRRDCGIYVGLLCSCGAFANSNGGENQRNRVIAKVFTPNGNTLDFDLQNLADDRTMQIIDLLNAAAIDPINNTNAEKEPSK